MTSLSSAFTSSALWIWAGVILLGLLVYVPGLLIRARKNKKNRLAVLTVIYALLLFALYYFRISGHYGNAGDITHLTMANGKLCFLDARQGGHKTEQFKENRLFIVDPGNGNMITREYIGRNASIHKASRQLLLIGTGNVFVVYDVDRPGIERKISESWLTENFPQMSGGIAKISYQKELLLVESRKGTSYYYNPFSNALADHADLARRDIKHFSCYYKKVSWWDNGMVRDVFMIRGQQPGDRLEQVRSVAGSESPVLVSGESFVDATFLEADDKNNVILLNSYADTDHHEQKLTALDFRLQPKWTILVSSLMAGQETNGDEVVQTLIDAGFLYSGVEGTVSKIRISDGQIIWQQQY